MTPHGVFVRVADLQSCRVATNAMIDDEPTKNMKNKPVFGRKLRNMSLLGTLRRSGP